jgi:hypothetical protein
VRRCARPDGHTHLDPRVKLDRPYTVNEAGIGIAFVTDPWGTDIEINERVPQ